MLPVLSILILQGRLANVNTGVATSGSCWLHARAAETLDLPWEWAYLDICIGTACCSAPRSSVVAKQRRAEKVSMA